MPHDLYLVGSVPMANSEQAMEAVGTALGSRIKRIPDGETGERGDWITSLEPVFAASSALQKSGEFFRVHATGTGRERYTLKLGCKPQDVSSRFTNTGMALPLGSPEDLGHHVETDSRRWKDVIGRAGIKLQ